MIVLLVLLLVVVLLLSVRVSLTVTYRRSVSPAPLESGQPRDAVRSAIKRRE